MVCVDEHRAGEKWDWKKWGVQPPTGQIKLGDREVQVWVEAVVRDASRLVKESKYFSTGGDEVVGLTAAHFIISSLLI